MKETTPIRSLGESKEKEVTGILHIAGERMNRYEFALKIADALKLSRDLVRERSITIG